MKTTGFLLAALVVPAVALAQPPSLKEKYKEKLVCKGGLCQETATGSFVSTFKLIQVDPAIYDSFNENTVFRVAIGNFSFEQPLGFDPNYEAGDTDASMRYVTMLANGKAKTVLTVKISWKNDILTFRLKGLTPFMTSPVAAGRAGFDLFPIEEAASFSFSNTETILDGSWPNWPYPSKTKRKTKTVDGVPYELDTIKVTTGAASDS